MKGLTKTISTEGNHKQCRICFMPILVFPYNDIAMKDRLLLNTLKVLNFAGTYFAIGK